MHALAFGIVLPPDDGRSSSRTRERDTVNVGTSRAHLGEDIAEV
jgi:hypothetical protein